MAQIVPETLKTLRTRRGWTQEKLADRSGVDKQTIHRLEHGRAGRTRKLTIDNLAGALKVKRDVLLGEAPLPHAEERPSRLDISSEMTIRISDLARNSLVLVSDRYGVDRVRALDAAPFLFAWAAEMSLRQRRERLADFEQRSSSIEQMKDDFPHLSTLMTWNMHAEDVIAAERASIDQRDIFGTAIPFDDGEIGNSDAEPGEDNPFARFLRGLAGQIGGGFSFDWWGEGETPLYEVCGEQALSIVGGNEKAATAIVRGVARLHAMPPEIRSGPPEARAKWAIAEHADFIAELDGVPTGALEGLADTNEETQ